MINAALALADFGFHIFPITPGQKSPPLIKRWPELATNARSIVLSWWTDNPNANIGCHVGGTGHIVLDVDVKGEGDKNGFVSLAKREKEFGPLPGDAWTVATPSGGVHYWYKMPEGVIATVSVSKLGDGLDIRSFGGYVLMPPSIVDGKRYEWDTPPAPHFLQKPTG